MEIEAIELYDNETRTWQAKSTGNSEVEFKNYIKKFSNEFMAWRALEIDTTWQLFLV